jgi:hypothetical protein
MARRKSIAPCAMNSRISWPNFEPAAAGLHHTAPNGRRPAAISESAAKHALTRYRSQFSNGFADFFINVRGAEKNFLEFV